jgi:hypothetical protein
VDEGVDAALKRSNSSELNVRKERLAELLVQVRDLLLYQNMSSFELQNVCVAEALLAFLSHSTTTASTGAGGGSGARAITPPRTPAAAGSPEPLPPTASGGGGGGGPVSGDLADQADLQMRVAVFEEVFARRPEASADGDRSAWAVAEIGRRTKKGPLSSKAYGGPNAGRDLVTLLVGVLQDVERLPLLVHSSPGSGHGLQVLTKRLQFRLRLHEGETTLRDVTGRTVKMEPLASVRTLEKYLLQKITLQWHNQKRAAMGFLKGLGDGGGQRPTFAYAADFDENGIMHWLGTNGGSSETWCNPSKVGLVFVSTSGSDPDDPDGYTTRLPFGSVDDVLSRSEVPKNCHTADKAGGWIRIDTGLQIVPSAYTLRVATGYTQSALRNWQLEGSSDGASWTTLRSHENDEALTEAGSSHTWRLDAAATGSESGGAAAAAGGEIGAAYRYLRIRITGPNWNPGSHYISLSGFEIYGQVVGAVLDPIGPSGRADGRSSGNGARSGGGGSEPRFRGGGGVGARKAVVKKAMKAAKPPGSSGHSYLPSTSPFSFATTRPSAAEGLLAGPGGGGGLGGGPVGRFSVGAVGGLGGPGLGEPAMLRLARPPDDELAFDISTMQAASMFEAAERGREPYESLGSPVPVPVAVSVPSPSASLGASIFGGSAPPPHPSASSMANPFSNGGPSGMGIALPPGFDPDDAELDLEDVRAHRCLVATAQRELPHGGCLVGDFFKAKHDAQPTEPTTGRLTPRRCGSSSC